MMDAVRYVLSEKHFLSNIQQTDKTHQMMDAVRYVVSEKHFLMNMPPWP